MFRTRGFLCVALVLGVVAVAQAGEVRHDGFILAVDPQGGIAGGGGTGAGGGTWYPYDSGWINQWFWNDPFTWGWKWIEFDIAWNKMILTDPTGVPSPPGSIEIAINWSTPAWSLVGNPPSDPRMPPLPPLTAAEESLYIHREIVASDLSLDFDPTGGHVSGRIIIPNYNPEWVSIDVRGFNFQIIGKIDHQCMVPTPSAAWGGISLLGALGIGSGRRLRRKAA